MLIENNLIRGASKAFGNSERPGAGPGQQREPHRGTGHADDSRGLSYQTQPQEIWDAIRNPGNVIIIMSDRNPILEKMLQGIQFNPLTPSQNHGSLGQNHLRDDGSTASLHAPVVGGDMIWILEGKNRGIDIFLTH